MRKPRKVAIASLIFAVMWIAWCFFVVFVLEPAIAQEELYDHIFLISWALCVLPLPFFGFYVAAILRG